MASKPRAPCPAPVILHLERWRWPTIRPRFRDCLWVVETLSSLGRSLVEHGARIFPDGRPKWSARKACEKRHEFALATGPGLGKDQSQL